jgi:hypothetical protein
MQPRNQGALPSVWKKSIAISDLSRRVRRGRRELGRTLDVFKVPDTEKEEVLAAFAAHKGEVPEGHSE